jgi:hypothetical protein
VCGVILEHVDLCASPLSAAACLLQLLMLSWEMYLAD